MTEAKRPRGTGPDFAGFLLLIALLLCAFSSYAHADSEEEMNTLRDLVTVFQNGDRSVTQDITLSDCVLKLRVEYSTQYLYPKDAKTIKYCYQRTINSYDVPLRQMDAGSMEIVSDDDVAGVKACTRGKKKIISHSFFMVLYDGKTVDEKTSLEYCFEIHFPADTDVGQQIRKALRNLIGTCN